MEPNSGYVYALPSHTENNNNNNNNKRTILQQLHEECNTVYVEIFAVDYFSRISRVSLHSRK